MLDDFPPSMAPTGFPILVQPCFHGLDLLDTCALLLVHLVAALREGEQANLPPKIRGLSSLSQPFKAWDHLYLTPT